MELHRTYSIPNVSAVVVANQLQVRRGAVAILLDHRVEISLMLTEMQISGDRPQHPSGPGTWEVFKIDYIKVE